MSGLTTDRLRVPKGRREMFGRIVLIVLGSVLASSAVLAAIADDIGRTNPKKINQCVSNYKNRGANENVVRKYCTCMNSKMDSSEIQSILEWEETHISEQRTCGRDAGWR
jgi:hypothetical protein